MSVAETQPVDLVVILTARDPTSVPELRTLLREQADRSRAEPGCLRFELFESTTVANTFVLVERWESPAALDVHRNADACQTLYFPKVVPLVERVPYALQPL